MAESITEMVARLEKGRPNPQRHLIIDGKGIKWTSKHRIQALFDLMYGRIAQLEAESDAMARKLDEIKTVA